MKEGDSGAYVEYIMYSHNLVLVSYLIDYTVPSAQLRARYLLDLC